MQLANKREIVDSQQFSETLHVGFYHGKTHWEGRTASYITKTRLMENCYEYSLIRVYTSVFTEPKFLYSVPIPVKIQFSVPISVPK